MLVEEKRVRRRGCLACEGLPGGRAVQWRGEVEGGDRMEILVERMRGEERRGDGRKRKHGGMR